MSHDDEFVLLEQVHDSVQAEMMMDLLEQEGIRVSTSGLNHRALFGMAGSFVEITLRVRESQLEEAKALLAALEDGEVVDDEDGAADEEDAIDDDSAPQDDDDEPRTGQPRADARRKRIAWGASFIFPGGAHFYARDAVRGLTIIVAYMLVLIGDFAWDTLALWMLPVVWLADVVGASEAVDRFNTMTTSQLPSARFARLFAWTAPLWALAPATTSYGLAYTAPSFYVGGAGRAVCEHLASCRDEPLDACIEESALLVASQETRRARLATCATCLGELRCDRVWQEITCDEEPTWQPSGCVAGPMLNLCQTSCRSLLPSVGRPSDFLEPLDPSLFY